MSNIAFTTEIRPATTHDLMYCAGTLKINAIYYIQDPKSRKLSGPYCLHKFTNSKVLENYYNSGCIYVPVIDFNFDIQENLQQQGFQKMQLLKEAGREVA